MNFPAFKKFALVLIASSALIVTSCQKDNEEDPEPTKKELLSNKWKIIDVQTADGTSIINIAPQAKCMQNNIVTIKTDNTFSFEDVPDECDPPFAGTGTWSFVENETKVKFEVSGGDPLTLTIKDLNATTLKLSYYFEDAPIPGDYTVVLQKQ
ncbi:MAG: lipocalin family protein [Agriterribacter sp.]